MRSYRRGNFDAVQILCRCQPDGERAAVIGSILRRQLYTPVALQFQFWIAIATRYVIREYKKHSRIFTIDRISFSRWLESNRATALVAALSNYPWTLTDLTFFSSPFSPPSPFFHPAVPFHSIRRSNALRIFACRVSPFAAWRNDLLLRSRIPPW